LVEWAFDGECIPYDSGSGLHLEASIDWELSESPSLAEVNDSYLATGCLVSVGELGVDMFGLCTDSPEGTGRSSWFEDMADG
jgi:hypothetical protein